MPEDVIEIKLPKTSEELHRQLEADVHDRYYSSIRNRDEDEQEKKITLSHDKLTTEEEKEGILSVVTRNYFRGWETLEIQGNPGIKDKIRENIIKAEKRNQRTYEVGAADLSISVEEFKARLQQKVEDMVGGADFFVATQLSLLDKIMNIDGRWKTQFETGTSRGKLDLSLRANHEKRMYGFEDDQEKNRDRRPIIGYFSDEEHGAQVMMGIHGEIIDLNTVEAYGTIIVKIKKDRALKKATITFQDSLRHDPNGESDPPTPAVKPYFTSFSLVEPAGPTLKRLIGSSIINWGWGSTEAQYHDQLTVDDVESIHISTRNGLGPKDFEKVRGIFNIFKQRHPKSSLQLIEF